MPTFLHQNYHTCLLFFFFFRIQLSYQYYTTKGMHIFNNYIYMYKKFNFFFNGLGGKM